MVVLKGIYILLYFENPPFHGHGWVKHWWRGGRWLSIMTMITMIAMMIHWRVWWGMVMYGLRKKTEKGN